MPWGRPHPWVESVTGQSPCRTVRIRNRTFCPSPADRVSMAVRVRNSVVVEDLARDMVREAAPQSAIGKARKGALR
jgi:hypothetical protein